MDWDKLKAFYAVAEAGSFTHASERLKLSQSSISRQIANLEESLGVTLFHRHARGLILTEQGEILFETAQSIFRQLSLIEGRLHDTKDEASGTLLITVAEFVGSSWLAPQLPAFLKENPGIKLSMILEDRILNLGMREADAAIRLYKPEQQDLIQRKLGQIHFSLCASEEYLKKYGTPVSLHDLAEHFIIGHPEEAPAPYKRPNWHFESADIDPNAHRKALLVNSMNTSLQAAKQGLGIAALPNFLIESDTSLVKILRKDASHQIDVYYVYPQEHRNSKRISLLKEFLIKQMDTQDM